MDSFQRNFTQKEDHTNMRGRSLPAFDVLLGMNIHKRFPRIIIVGWWWKAQHWMLDYIHQAGIHLCLFMRNFIKWLKFRILRFKPCIRIFCSLHMYTAEEISQKFCIKTLWVCKLSIKCGAVDLVNKCYTWLHCTLRMLNYLCSYS